MKYSLLFVGGARNEIFISIRKRNRRDQDIIYIHRYMLKHRTTTTASHSQSVTYPNDEQGKVSTALRIISRDSVLL